ncbi:MAG: hypothetical protein QM571_01690, partial [Micrococcaceae bacterium]
SVLTSTGISVDASTDVKNFKITVQLGDCSSVTDELEWIYPNLMTWGSNSTTQYRLGNGSTANTNIPGAIGSTYKIWRKVVSQSHSFALTSNNELWGWGYNDSGQLGNNTTVNQATPVRIGTSSWGDVAAGASGSTGFSLGYFTNGRLLGWGDNAAGQLGTNSITDSYTPNYVNNEYAQNPWINVSGANRHSMAISGSGNTLWGWGSNEYGETGNGSPSSTNILTATQVGTNATWSQVAAGAEFTVALRSTGRIYAWGRNQYGQLGNGTTTDQSTIAMGPSTGIWSKFDAQNLHVLAINTSNKLYAWGRNNYGQVGNNTLTDASSPVQVSDLEFASVSAGYSHSVALTTDGDLYTWGNNGSGQLGNGANARLLVPTKVGNLKWDAVDSGVDFTVGVARTFVPKGYSY